MEKDIKGVICLCGNDGTGKSTLSQLFSEKHPDYLVLERSTQQFSPDLIPLHQQIKQIDQLTFRYAFEKERKEFEPSSLVNLKGQSEVKVHWILLNLKPEEIKKRIRLREKMGIYESSKCLEYFSYVYLEIAAFYGMTIVDAACNPHQMCDKVLRMIQSGAVSEIRNLQLKKISISRIQNLSISAQIIDKIDDEVTQEMLRDFVEEDIQADPAAKEFFYPEFKELLHENGKINHKLAKNLIGQWLTTHHKPQISEDGQLYIKWACKQKQHRIGLQSPCFSSYTEGESKMVFQVISSTKEVTQYFADKVWIILKSTIYSHTNQHTGQIFKLGQIRAVGSNLFLQMLRRNNLDHAYISINSQGIILSRKIEVNMIEVIFKKQFVGTDKHSYYGMNQIPLLVGNQAKLKNGIYIRFDWRNPNHVIKNHPSYLINQNKYYYVLERSIGKQNFFQRFLRKENIKPIGDKCITEDLIKNYVHTTAIKKAVLSLYCAFAYYCRRVNLEIIDGCFMFDLQGSVVWSEINPDCMRVKKIESNNERLDYDKDIWRIGGSSSKDKIKDKWTLFNKLLIDYFEKNRFFETQLLTLPPLSYTKSEEALRFLHSPEITLSEEYTAYFNEISQNTQKKRQLIATIDISEGKPTLVKSSKVTEHHSDGDLDTAYNRISVLPKMVCVDLDAALGKDHNREAIKHLKRKGLSNFYGIGGGIRSLQILNYYLNDLTVPKAILSSSLQLLDHLSRQVIANRIIVELSINEKNEVLTHGRTVNTGQNVITKMVELSQKGLKIVSLTFNHKEGHLSGIPREQFRDIMFSIPGPIQKVIIAGGISSLQDIEFIWGFPKAVPQLGSAIWKNKVEIPELLSKLIEFKNQDICPAIISTESGKLLGEVFMNKQAIKMTVETRYLYRYSRKLNRLIQKGEESGNTQKIVEIRLDCDHDCLNIVVQDSSHKFCHLEAQSCFDGESINHLETMGSLQQHILQKKTTGSGYSRKMQQNEHFSALKIQEEVFELISSKNRVTEEGADLLAHLLMFLNAKNIPLKSIMTELNCRAKKLRDLQELVSGSRGKVEKFACMGLMDSKYIKKLDESALKLLGISIVRPKGRSLKGQIVIEDEQKYNKYFDGCKLETMIIKAKDMVQMLYKKEIKWCFNYSIVMENSCKIWKQIVKEPIPIIKLCAIKKKDRKVDPLSWTKNNKGKIASEYPISMISYLNQLGVSEQAYSIYRVSGSSEAYLDCKTFDYCDAIVETGSTLEQNQLQIVKVLCEEIYGALYTLI